MIIIITVCFRVNIVFIVYYILLGRCVFLVYHVVVHTEREFIQPNRAALYANTSLKSCQYVLASSRGFVTKTTAQRNDTNSLDKTFAHTQTCIG